MFLAGLILYSRPFVAMVLAALTSPHSDGSPEGLIWTKRFTIGVGWILLFLARTKGTLVRAYFLSTWRHEGPSYHIELDGSPWGLGGILSFTKGHLSGTLLALSPSWTRGAFSMLLVSPRDNSAGRPFSH
eukprot:3446133-Amphidinium_carterae.1